VWVNGIKFFESKEKARGIFYLSLDLVWAMYWPRQGAVSLEQ